MANYLIITEKPSAAQNFVKALGGKLVALKAITSISQTCAVT